MIPTYERQNKWIKDYLQPLVEGRLGDFAKNYRENRRDALRADMQKAGVFDSLQKLEREGPECDKPFREFADAVRRKYVSVCSKYDSVSILGEELGGPGIGPAFINNLYLPFCLSLRSYYERGRTTKPDEETLQMIFDIRRVSEERHDYHPPRGPPAAAA
ncbi:Uncharacterised protein [uncultured archaeon]|nr:Uncharacterised protein [uncultured archaeon]